MRLHAEDASAGSELFLRPLGSRTSRAFQPSRRRAVAGPALPELRASRREQGLAPRPTSGQGARAVVGQSTSLRTVGTSDVPSRTLAGSGAGCTRRGRAGGARGRHEPSGIWRAPGRADEERCRAPRQPRECRPARGPRAPAPAPPLLRVSLTSGGTRAAPDEGRRRAGQGEAAQDVRALGRADEGCRLERNASRPWPPAGPRARAAACPRAPSAPHGGEGPGPRHRLVALRRAGTCRSRRGAALYPEERGSTAGAARSRRRRTRPAPSARSRGSRSSAARGSSRAAARPRSSRPDRPLGDAATRRCASDDGVRWSVVRSLAQDARRLELAARCVRRPTGPPRACRRQGGGALLRPRGAPRRSAIGPCDPSGGAVSSPS